MTLINLVYGHTQVPGYAVHQGNSSAIWSAAPLEGCDVYLYFDAFSYTGHRSNCDVLLQHEPMIVLPGQCSEQVWQRFDYVLTYVDHLVDRGGKFHGIRLPAYGIPIDNNINRIIDLTHRRPLAEKRTAICMINGNKKSAVPGQLYSKRAEIARWFHDHSDIPFDVYGRPPFDLPNYHGELSPYSKLFPTWSQYRYALAFENIYHPLWSAGYVDKFLDVVMCGTVPICLGGYNIEDHLPRECFIDFREFGDYDELARFLYQISDSEYNFYIESIRDWVSAGNLHHYSLHRIFEKVVTLADPGADAEELATMPWKHGLAVGHENPQWRVIQGDPVWSWDYLSSTIPTDLLGTLLKSMTTTETVRLGDPLWSQMVSDFLSQHGEWQAFLRNYVNDAQESLDKGLVVQTQNHMSNETPLPRTGEREHTSIIVLNLNGGAHIKPCIESIQDCTKAPHELIVVDNGSSDGSLEYLRSVPGIQLIENADNVGAPYARNQGLALANGEYIVFLDNDTVVTHSWLQLFIDYAKANPSVSVWGPRSNYVSGPQRVDTTQYSHYEELQTFAQDWARTIREPGTLSGRLVLFCLFVKHEVIRKIGGIDPAYKLWGWEDDDFGVRAQLAGYQMAIANKIYIHHTGSQTSESANIDYDELMQENCHVFYNKWAVDGTPEDPLGYNLNAILAQHTFDPIRHLVTLPPRLEIEQLLYCPNKPAAGAQQSDEGVTADGVTAVEQIIGRVLENDQPDRAKAILETAAKQLAQLTERFSDLALAHAALGATLLALDQVEASLPALRRAVALAPHTADFRHQLDMALSRTNDVEDTAPSHFAQPTSGVD